MKIYVVLALTIIVILGAYFYMKRQDAQQRPQQVASNGQGPSIEEKYEMPPENVEEFNFSSAQSSHTRKKAEREGAAGGISDDLLIVESHLEERAERARH